MKRGKGNKSRAEKKEYMSHLPPTARSADDIQDSAETHPSLVYPQVDLPLSAEEENREKGEKEEGEERVEKQEEEKVKEETKEEKTEEEAEEEKNGGERMSQVLIAGDTMAASMDVRPRPRLTTSNSGADIMLGLETDDGKSAEVEIDSLESDELQPEEIPKGRVRKTSIVEKLSKSKESELIALSIMESAGQRQREFEKLISEHQELVQEISRTPSAENIVQSETGRDP